MTRPTNFPRIPAGLMLIPYAASVGDLPVELHGTFCPFSEEFEAQAIVINVKGELIDLTANLSQRLLDNFNRDMRIAGIGKDYARELREARREEACERRRDEHEYAGI